VVLLAYQGYCEEREETERMMFAAHGNPLPPKIPERRTGQNFADEWRIFKIGHNAQIRPNRSRRGIKPNG